MLLLISHGSYVPPRIHVIRVKYQLFDVQLFCDTAYTRSRVPRISGIADYLSKKDLYLFNINRDPCDGCAKEKQIPIYIYAFLLGLYSQTNRYYFEDIATQENYMRISIRNI